MAVIITLIPGNNADKLHHALVTAIADGDIETWQYDIETGFTHTASSNGQQQWNQGAYLAYGESVRGADTVVKLYFQVLPDAKLAKNTYGTLNGRFAGMLLNHFKSLVKSIQLIDLRK